VHRAARQAQPTYDTLCATVRGVTRKMCGGGNRTRHGADSQQVLASVLRTADQRGLDATDVLVALLTAPTPTVPPSLLVIPAVH
jgi:hypothetical protein